MGDGITVGVLVGTSVNVGVKVGGNLRAVCVAAAFAVSTITVYSEFGSNVGSGAGVGARDGNTQASVNTVTATREKNLVLRRIMIAPVFLFHNNGGVRIAHRAVYDELHHVASLFSRGIAVHYDGV